LESICKWGQAFFWRPFHQHCLEQIKLIARQTPILKPIDPKGKDPIWLICDTSVCSVGALYGQGPHWQTYQPAGFMPKKFTSAQRSYKTYEQEALAIIEGLLKWEDKLLGRKIMIASDHKALEAVKTAAHRSFSGRLIRWDEYLSKSRFDFEIFHVEGVKHKVANCLSRYYENDQPDEHHPWRIRLGRLSLRPRPGGYDEMTKLRTEELIDYLARLHALRAEGPLEDRIVEARELEQWLPYGYIPKTKTVSILHRCAG
jgi:hypothetical protein